jgi:hypothetical protein
MTAMDDMSSMSLGGKRRTNFRAALATQILERNSGGNFRSTGPQLVSPGDDPSHRSIPYLVIIGFGPDLAFLHSSLQCQKVRTQSALDKRNLLSKLVITLGVTRLLQCASQPRGAVFRPFLFEPSTDGGIGRFGMFALVCGYVREQLAQPLVGPFPRRTPSATLWEKDMR